LTTQTTDQKRIADLEAEIAQVRQQGQEAALRTVPADQRAAYTERLNLQEQQRLLTARETELNEAARTIHARELASQTGQPAETFMVHASLQAMDQAALQIYRTTLQDPKQMREFATWLEKNGSPVAAAAKAEGNQTPVTPAADPATEAAPAAAAQAPAGVPGASGGTSSLGPTPSQEITERHAGKGDMVGWLAEQRTQPMEVYTLGGEPAGPTPAPAVAQQAEPAPAQGGTETT
jgi:hypothetical protein